MSTAKNLQTIRENDPTVRESAATPREDGTIREDQDGTVRDAPDSTFRPVRQLATRGAEADIYLIREGQDLRVLKLYRHGLDPKREIMERYERISRECPHHVVRVYRTGVNKKSGRWYELLEYIPDGSVADMLERGEKFDFRQFVGELAGAVHALHEHGIVHRDLKPGNILVRSREPLDLALADFGISSVLDQASIRETMHKGLTPMYAAPEDMLGYIVSRPADWWACGMIFYEVLLGAHPFQGLSPGRITYLLSTRGVEIDESLPEDQKLLLAGLLTRNDKKRWGWAQIGDWLAGKANIPVFYEKSGEARGIAPFVFEGKSYSSLHDLALAFASGCKQSKTAKGMLARGNVAKWLQNTNQFDEEAVLSEEIACNDADLYLFKFIRKYAPELPFALYGLAVTPENVLAWLQGNQGEAEKKILSLFANGSIEEYLNLLPQNLRDERLLAIAGVRWDQDLSMPIAAMLQPENFYWGPRGIPPSPRERLHFAIAHPGLISMESWRKMGGPDFVIPPQAAELFRNGSYEEAIALLEDLSQKGHILLAADLNKSYPDNVYTGSESDYNLSVGRKNGLDNSAARLMAQLQRAIDQVDKKPSMPNGGLIQHECGLVRECLHKLETGKIPWQPAIGKTLAQINKDLNWLLNGGDLMKYLRAIVEYLAIPAFIAYVGIYIYTSISAGTETWTESGIFKGLTTVIYVICGLVGLAAGGLGVIPGLIIAWLICLALEMLVKAAGVLILVAFAALVIGGIIYYLRFQARQWPLRNKDRHNAVVRDLREQILKLPR